MKRGNPKISIIIPVLNEEDRIGELITFLYKNSTSKNIAEILVIDGGSNDNTVSLAKKTGAKVYKSEKGRAKQMNYGVRMAKGEILYFLHADTFPSKNFDQYIVNAISHNQQAGCFQMKFDSDNWALQFFAWFTRYNHMICRGGDQSLFISKELFKKTKGFNEDYIIFEDNEFIGRIYQKTNFKILPYHVKTSARKYRKLGVFKLQYHFGVIHLKNYLGAGPEKLYDYYKRKIAL
ncbi:MAG: glycosyltransferase family 2 protein [Maribacter sp.]|nr:glycosyltransferase family 2 protein [Maribacter sp.]NNK18759.1 glycosyltransferase family 2 protein [Maribacter sp.]